MPGPLYEFGPFQLDAGARRLTRDGAALPVRRVTSTCWRRWWRRRARSCPRTRSWTPPGATSPSPTTASSRRCRRCAARSVPRPAASRTSRRCRGRATASSGDVRTAVASRHRRGARRAHRAAPRVGGRPGRAGVAGRRPHRRGARRVRARAAGQPRRRDRATSAWPMRTSMQFETDACQRRRPTWRRWPRPRSHAREACRLRSAEAARRGPRSASSSTAPATGRRPWPRCGGRCRSSPTTGATTSGCRSSAGARRACAPRAARWRCCRACRSRTGWRPRCTWRGRRSTKPRRELRAGIESMRGHATTATPSSSPASRSSGCSA